MVHPSLPLLPDSVDRCGRHRREVGSGQVPFWMHVGLLPLIPQYSVICPGLNGSQFVRVSWLLTRFLQEWGRRRRELGVKAVGRPRGDASQGWDGDVREQERRL